MPVSGPSCLIVRLSFNHDSSKCASGIKHGRPNSIMVGPRDCSLNVDNSRNSLITRSHHKIPLLLPLHRISSSCEKKKLQVLPCSDVEKVFADGDFHSHAPQTTAGERCPHDGDSKMNTLLPVIGQPRLDLANSFV